MGYFGYQNIQNAYNFCDKMNATLPLSESLKENEHIWKALHYLVPYVRTDGYQVLLDAKKIQGKNIDFEIFVNIENQLNF